MNERRFNWPLWIGFILTPVAFLSYFVFFAKFPITRDVPWVNLILFAIAVALLFAGIRRAYATPSTARKVIATLVVVIGVAITAAFVYAAYPGSRVPQSASAPAIGSHAPDFTLPDTNNQPVSLSQTLASAPKGVLLVFYRGYW